MLSKEQGELLGRIRNLQRKFHKSSQELEIFVSDFEKRLLDASYDFGQFQTDGDILNDLGLFFLRRGMYTHAELLYRFLLNIINAQELKHGRIHKGLPLHNMGVAQIQQRNYDEGIPNILAAFDEDVWTLGSRVAAEKQLAYKLKEGFIGFVSGELDRTYMPILKRQMLTTGFRSATASDLLSLLSEDQRLLLARIVNSKVRRKFRSDMYTRLVLLDNLKNLCLLLEATLRDQTGASLYLPKLIIHAFSRLSWIKIFQLEVRRAKKDRLTYFQNAQDFEIKFGKISSTAFSSIANEDFTVKCFLLSCLVRNFTAHEFENVSLLKDPAKYDSAFSNITLALLYALNRYV